MVSLTTAFVMWRARAGLPSWLTLVDDRGVEFGGGSAHEFALEIALMVSGPLAWNRASGAVGSLRRRNDRRNLGGDDRALSLDRAVEASAAEADDQGA